MPFYLDQAMSTQATLFDVARGHYSNMQAVNVFGFNREVGTTLETIWNDGGQYTFLSSAQQLSVVSDSASDTMDVLISGLDSSYNEINETVTLTGTTAVTTTSSFLRVNQAIILAGSNVGDITGTYSSTKLFHIEATQGLTQACVYTVPAGHELYLFRIDLSSGTVSPNQYITYRNVTHTHTGRTLRVAESTWAEGQQSFDRQVPFKIAEKTDFTFEAMGSNNVNEVSIFIEAVLVGP